MEKNTPAHPGAYVRQNVIPSGMSVKVAAERLGIGRPALSNFLNGKSSLSPKMAVRLEKAFGADQEQLIDMQSAYDRQMRLADEKEITVRAFVPNFLTIKARQIEDWANSQIDARTHLPVLLRKLVHSTGKGLLQVDFPGYDNGQRKGSDGFVKSEVATPWIPEGNSFWEFGTDQRPDVKAKKDYNARLTSVDPDVRANSTFVFITPRNWTHKTEWEEQKNKAGDWKAVRAFDASDLEQWLEQSVPAQIWLAEQLAQPVRGYETLETAWSRWANVSEPRLEPVIFAPSIAAYRDTFKDWLNKSTNKKPLIVAADSRDEALAFLACLFEEEDLRQYKDLAAVFTSPETLSKLVSSSVSFIPIVPSEDAERELTDAYRRLHCIVFRPRNAVDLNADIKLDLLSYSAFKEAITSIGIEEGNVDRLARESGRSPTVLRRRLSQNDAIKWPVWAGDDDRAKALVPMAMIGAWCLERKVDREIVSNIANREYDTMEDEIARLLQFDDSPVWSTGRYRGVVSKIDALFAVARMATSGDLERFFVAAEYVLSESDPALDLPEKDRWAAALYDKTRNHSSALRKGICETLVILSVHGNNLFHSRLGINVEDQVALLIRKLLTPLTLEKLLSQDRDLPRYAEAAPDEFLEILEDDLRSNAPVVFGLLKPIDSSLFGTSPSRTGLLWGLECLSWKPQYLPRVSLILAQLSRLKIDDNWANKPEASLNAIFRSWMPQTAASLEQRFKVLEMLINRFPDVGWEICIEQIKPGSRIGHYSYRPNWRSDASGAGQVVTRKEMYDFNRKALNLLISWARHDERTLGDLVECLQGMLKEDQTKVWDLIDEWSENADEVAKAALRERIRQFAFTRRSRHRKLEEATRNRAREAYDSLRPLDPVIRHGWLFADSWVQESTDESGDEDFDYRKREEKIDRLRLEAMIEIWSERGFEGVKELITSSGAAGVIGRYTALCITDVKQQVDFICHFLSLDRDLHSKVERCLKGFLLAIEDESRAEVIQATTGKLPPEEYKRLIVCAPFQASTWHLLDNYGEDIRSWYWNNVLPSWGPYTSDELTELIDSLLTARRPRAAFHAVHMNFKDLETSLLMRLLKEVATVYEEPADHFKLDNYYISEALESLDCRPGVNREEMAQLEFLFIDALDHSTHGIPNLERQIAQTPVLFVQAVALAYKRSDDGEDPPEWRIEDPEQRAAVALAAHRLLDQISKIPGTDEIGRIDAAALTEWLAEVRRLCHEYGRVEIGDQCLGNLLSKAPAGENGIWPCQSVCKAMDEIASQDIGKGFSIGVYNSRGVHSRGVGGDQERDLATKYHTWAEHFHFDYPYVGVVLKGIAESYEREAKRHDSEAKIEKRLQG
ncbi:HigA family addiction module antitoxin [Alkalihalobacillus sp. TS-13]|uniref:HigA family addiction module antitoxin n=1 Tax=Alkalihalobacillus sp. TS-13 TaxID=2842455 RepID=UPI001C86BC3C|nr:HigA family addiction module antitoxin [Alkalihalobacillus sp. TS-13]